MTDKERILSLIITKIIPHLMYASTPQEIHSYACPKNHTSEFKVGDLVFARTSIIPNEFSVGFVYEIHSEYLTIREIGTNNICNYYNESFIKLNKGILGYELLEGEQYKIYHKVLKAISQASYDTRFKSISFKDNICTVQTRRAFEPTSYFQITFKYNSKTTIKSILKLIMLEEQRIQGRKLK